MDDANQKKITIDPLYLNVMRFLEKNRYEKETGALKNTKVTDKTRIIN